MNKKQALIEEVYAILNKHAATNLDASETLLDVILDPRNNFSAIFNATKVFMDAVKEALDAAHAEALEMNNVTDADYDLPENDQPAFSPYGTLIVKGLNEDGSEWENEHCCFLSEATYTAKNYPHKITSAAFEHCGTKVAL